MSELEVRNVFEIQKADSAEPKGVSGVIITGNGYLTSDEQNASLIGLKKYETYSEIISNVSIVAAGLRFFLNLLAKAEWNVEPADDSSEAQRIAENFEEIIDNMMTPWHRVVRRTAMARFYGFSLQEWTAWKTESGTIGYRDIAPRPQVTIERWDVDRPTGMVNGVWQRDPNNYNELYIPRNKLIYYVDDSINDSPEGLGLMRHLAEPAARLAKYEQLEGFGFETDLQGIPVGRAPYDEINRMVDSQAITAQDGKDMVEAVERFVANHIRRPDLGLILDSATYKTDDEKQSPSGNKLFDIDLLKGGSTSFADIDRAIQRLNHEMARIIGVEHLLLGQTRGTQALSEDKTHNFAMIVDSTLQEIEEVYETDFCGPIMRLNGWDPKLCPKMGADKMRYKDVRELTTALKDLTAASLAPDDPVINQIRAILGLEDAPDNTEDAVTGLMNAIVSDVEEEPELEEEEEEIK